MGLDHTLAEDDELDVADDGDAPPCHGSCPEGGVIGDTAGDSGEVRVRGGEEVKRNVRGENFLGEW